MCCISPFVFIVARQSNNVKHENVSISKRMNTEAEDVELFCPEEKEATFELFSRSCKSDDDCSSLSKAHRCCNLFGSLRCHEGFEKPLEDDLPHECEYFNCTKL